MTYDAAGNGGAGTLTVQLTTFATVNNAGQTFPSTEGFMIFTDPALGATPLKVIAQANSWVGDIFPALPGYTAGAEAASEIGGMGSFTAKCGTTIAGLGTQTDPTREINIFFPDVSLAKVFGITPPSPGGMPATALSGYLAQHGDTTFSEKSTTSGTATIAVSNNFSTDGYLVKFDYTFASPVTAVMGLSATKIAEEQGGGDAGDMDNDGDIDLTDLVMAMKVVVGLSPAGVAVGADVNSDSRIGLAKVIYILQDLAGL